MYILFTKLCNLLTMFSQPSVKKCFYFFGMFRINRNQNVLNKFFDRILNNIFPYVYSFYSFINKNKKKTQ